MASANDAPSDSTGDGELTYYKVDTSRLSYAEIWRVTAGNLLGFLVVSFVKLCGRSMRQGVATAGGNQQFIDADRVPAHVRKRLDPIVREFEREGFEYCFAVWAPQLGKQEAYLICTADRDGTMLAAAIYAQTGRLTEISSVLNSKLRDGRVLGTTNGRMRLHGPPEFLSLARPGTPVPKLVALHRKRMLDLLDGVPQPLDDLGRRQLVLDNAMRTLQFQRARGVLVPLSPDEVELLRAKRPAARAG